MGILSAQEAADTLKYNSPSDMPGNVMSILVPAIDDYMKTATGRTWGSDSPINPTAKLLASVLLVRWHEDPGMIGKASDIWVTGLITQLYVKALQMESDAT